MCGRYTLAGPNPGRLRERFALGDLIEIRRRFNVAPGDDVVCVTTSREGEPRGELLRWGLVPHWAKAAGNAYKTINARAETITERPTYRDAFARRRCLVVADGFIEWQARPDGPKQPFWITRADGAPFAFAGLWASWHGADEASLRSCSIVTTDANAAIGDIHARMPVILPPDAEAMWLDHGTPEPILRELMCPLPDDAVARREVSTVVNDARHDAPDCLDPPAPPTVTTLF